MDLVFVINGNLEVMSGVSDTQFHTRRIGIRML